MFKIIWDKPHNGVILTVNSAGEALSIAPRPVFYEELNLLGLDKRGGGFTLNPVNPCFGLVKGGIFIVE